jgi:hypothetical protein
MILMGNSITFLKNRSSPFGQLPITATAVETLHQS